jgi:hypothetical protein
MRRKEDGCLKDVRVARSSMKMDENVDFKTILESLPPFASQEKIIFRLDF